MTKEIMNDEELAELLSVTPKTISKWVGENKLPHFYIGRLLRFRLASILEWAGQLEAETRQQIEQEAAEKANRSATKPASVKASKKK